MGLENYISIAGKPGLYKIHSRTRTAVVAEELTTGKRLVTHPQLQVSLLSEIQIYTLTDVIPLAEVLDRMYTQEAGKATAISPKAPTVELTHFFEALLPEYDPERVYPNHIKKVIQWYNLLLQHKVLPLEATATSTKSKKNE